MPSEGTININDLLEGKGVCIVAITEAANSEAWRLMRHDSTFMIQDNSSTCGDSNVVEKSTQNQHSMCR